MITTFNLKSVHTANSSMTLLDVISYLVTIARYTILQQRTLVLFSNKSLSFIFQELVKLVGAYYIQYLYSFLVCCSLIVMLPCAPFGFILLFDVVGKLLVKPKILENNDEELTAARYEEVNLNGLRLAV